MITRLGRILATVTTVVVGLFVLIDLFMRQSTTDMFGLNRANVPTVGALFVNWAAIIAAFALLIGFVNVISVHVGRIRHRQPGIIYSGVLLLSLIATVLFGITGPTSINGQFLFDYILQPLEATFAALLALFIATAAYRAFRIRDFESFLFVLFAVVVLLGQLPIAVYLGTELPGIKDSLLINVLTLGGARGILLGVALGTIATGLRVLMGVDRPYAD